MLIPNWKYKEIRLAIQKTQQLEIEKLTWWRRLWRRICDYSI
jgi:hypothetical protein